MDIIKDNMTLNQFFKLKEWDDYFSSFSNTLDFELNIYDENGTELFKANENPFCKSMRSLQVNNRIKCTESCDKFIFESSQLNGPVMEKCEASQTRFTFAIERSGEKVYVHGVGGLAEYDDLLEYLEIAKSHNLSRVPASRPLSFPGANYLKAVSNYLYLTISRILNNHEEKSRLDEKLLRMTSLFDSQAFGTLSRNSELMYRYILDTIEFVFGSTSTVLMLHDKNKSTFSTTCSAGQYKDVLMDFFLEAESAPIQKMVHTRTAVAFENIEGIPELSQLDLIKSSCFFPIIVGGSLEVVIGIFNKALSREDMKIMNAFKDYIQLNLENRTLRIELSRKKKTDNQLTAFVEFAGSLTSVKDTEKLLNGFLTKTTQLLNAEQGSLMLLDHDTEELVVEARLCRDDTVQEKMRFSKDEGIAGQVLESGRSFLVKDIEKDPRIGKTNRPRYKTKSFLSVPIKIEEKLSGVINVSDKVEGGVFNEEDLELVESFIGNVAIAIERSLLYKKTEELRKLSITDPLTGIFNRRYLNRRLSEEITRYNRYKHPFSFMMLDMDKFKDYNDTYGHISGDKLLKYLAEIMEQSLRAIDIAARFGGDEFVAIFPQTPKVDAIQITNRLKEKIDIELSQNYSKMPLSVSMGLATFPDDASSIMELIEKTDQALYLAKKGGGNRVVYL